MAKKVKNIFIRGIQILREEGMIVFLERFLAWLGRREIGVFFLPFALLKIKNFNHNQDYSLDKLTNFAFNGFGKLILEPGQVQEEILELLRILEKIRPKIIIEIGTASGGSLFLFSHIASQDATIISVDLPGGPFGGGYPKWKIPLYKAFGLVNQKIHLIRADSHNRETLNKVKSILNNRKADFLFIDGDHSYKGVKKDFEMYSPLVKEEGIIAFHDIVIGTPETGCEVSKFWEEIKGRYNYMEIIKNQKQEWGGIGVLFLKRRNENS